MWVCDSVPFLWEGILEKLDLALQSRAICYFWLTVGRLYKVELGTPNVDLFIDISFLPVYSAIFTIFTLNLKKLHTPNTQHAPVRSDLEQRPLSTTQRHLAANLRTTSRKRLGKMEVESQHQHKHHEKTIF